MSILSRIIARLFASKPQDPQPDRLPLRDWADLPAYHPRCE